MRLVVFIARTLENSLAFVCLISTFAALILLPL